MQNVTDLTDAYEHCRLLTVEKSKTFYLSTLLLPKEKRQAIWALYAWCRRVDDLVDESMDKLIIPTMLDSWEQRLEYVFAGRPKDTFDMALTDTLKHFPINIHLFQEMVSGQRMDLLYNRYETFDDLYLYCYKVAGTVGLMSSAILGFDGSPSSADLDCTSVTNQKAIALGIAKQLTNILRDVGEDARRGRIYIPLEELAMFDYSEEDLFNSVVDNRWCNLMRFQIERARKYYAQAEQGIKALNREARWTVWASLMLYQGILDIIERNHYDVFRQRAYVYQLKKLTSVPVAWLRAQMW